MYRKNVASQNVPFELINLTNGSPLTGAAVTTYMCIDGGSQLLAAGPVTEKGNGQYNFAPTAADINGNDIGYLFIATGAVPVNVTIVTTAADPTNNVNFGLLDLDVNIGSRLAASAYTPPPDPATIAAVVWEDAPTGIGGPAITIIKSGPPGSTLPASSDVVNLEMYAGEDKIFQDVIYQPDGQTLQDITNWGLIFKVFEVGYPANVIILKTNSQGGGIVATSPTNGVLQIRVVDADTEGMPTQTYQYQICRTDLANDVVLTTGLFTVLGSVL